MLLKEERRKHYQKRILSFDYKGKSMWSIVKEIEGKPESNVVKIKGDLGKIANEFCNYFSENTNIIRTIPRK